MIRNVLTETVKKGLCSGCGICAGVADTCLSMYFNKHGEFVPKNSSCKNCGICLSFCPSINEANNSFIQGTYNYVGYSEIREERENGSSGGLTTRLLRTLLTNKLVDGVVVVGSSNKPGVLFEPFIVRKPEELIKYAGSKYYPIQFSDVIEELKTEKGQFAIVGLPCVVKGFRLLKLTNPIIGDKIKYLIGLTCGHNKNKNYTSMLIKLAEAKQNEVASVQYRSKNNIHKANNYGFKTILNNGEETKQLNFLDTIIKNLWCDRYFSLNACFYCKDVFAEYADVSFMDAWLEPYFNDPRGTSIAIVRNNQINSILKNEFNEERIFIKSIEDKEVVHSQIGAIKFRRSNNKRKFIFNSWFSNKVFSENNYLKRVIGAEILKGYIILKQTFRFN